MAWSKDRGNKNLFNRLTSQSAGVRHRRLGLWPTYQALNETINSRRKSDR